MSDVAKPSVVKSSMIFSEDSIRRLRQEFDEIAKRTYNTAIYDAKCEGLEEGSEKERSKNAISLMKNGASFDLIIKSLGISREKLLELAKKNNIAVEVDFCEGQCERENCMSDVAKPNAVKSSMIFSEDSIRRLRHEFDEIAKRTYNSEIEYAKYEAYKEEFKKGYKEGYKLGREKEHYKAAVSLMKNGASLDLLSKVLHFSIDELLEIARKNSITIKQ